MDEAMVRERPRVLVAEDDDDLRALIVWGLGTDGYDVVEARNGREAIDEVAGSLLLDEGERPPDLIITDVRMPGVTGVSLLAGIRARGWRIPIIVMTAYDIETMRPEADRLGADVVFSKPFDIDDLRTAAMNLLGRKRSGTHEIDIARRKSS
jgi:CheY-like chemotaxis protein